MDSTSSSTDLTTWSHPVPLLLCSLKRCLLLLLAFLIWIRYFPLTPVPLLRHRGTGETGARKPGKLWEGWWPRGCVQSCLRTVLPPLPVSTSQQDLQSEWTLWKHPVFCRYQCPLELNDHRSVALTWHIMKSFLIWGHLELMWELLYSCFLDYRLADRKAIVCQVG